MYIYIQNLYGANDGKKAYYRKVYDCFDFVSSKDKASQLSKEEAEKIMSYANSYKKQYNASVMGIEE